MQTMIIILLTLFMGIMLAVYLPMNSSVARYLGSPISASIPFFIVALITTILIFLLFADYSTISKMKNIPAYLFLPGFVAAFMIIGTTYLIPKVGARKFFILVITGQILMAMIISHFGILESPKDAITLKKMLGALLMVVGAFISTV